MTINVKKFELDGEKNHIKILVKFDNNTDTEFIGELYHALARAYKDVMTKYDMFSKVQ